MLEIKVLYFYLLFWIDTIFLPDALVVVEEPGG